METVSQINIPLKLKSRGKVRDIFELDEKLVMVATDRISVFDLVLPSLIPFKGVVLTQLSAFWFKKMEKIIPNHVITSTFEDFPEELLKYDFLKGRAVIVKKAQPLLVECIVRGYLAGSAWNNYLEKKPISGIRLAEGLRESEELAEPIFTPSTKAAVGHDEEMTEEKLINLLGKEMANKLKEVSLKIYKEAAGEMKEKGIIVADTKFEFGLFDDNLILIDELLTPDSSRFWPKDDFETGRSQKSFDKQFVRDYVTKIGWNKEPPVPELPKEIIEETSNKYLEAYEKITGGKLII